MHGRRLTDEKMVLTAFSRKPGQNPGGQGIPLLIEIKQERILVNVVKNSTIGSGSGSIVPVIGQAYVRKSHKGSNQMRLVNVFVDSAACTYLCRGIY
jgi:hypothetical protein